MNSEHPGTRRSHRKHFLRFRLAATAILALASCRRSPTTGPELDSIDPSAVSPLVATDATIHGRNFFDVLRASLDGGPATLDTRWAVTIGAVPLDSGSVSRVDSGTLAIVVPAGLPVGVHSVTALSPDGRSATLIDALTVVSSTGGTVHVVSVSVPPDVTTGEQDIRVEMRVENTTVFAAPLVGARIRFSLGATDLGQDYTVETDDRSPSEVPALSVATLHFWIQLKKTGVQLGPIDVIGEIEAYLPGRDVFVVDDEPSAWTVVAGDPPEPAIDAPSPGGRRVCQGGSISFIGSATIAATPDFFWTLPGGNPASASGMTSPAIAYDAIGSHPFWLTVVDSSSGLRSSRKDTGPVFVGVAESAPGQKYPTGAVLFQSPVAGQAFDLAVLPTGGAFSTAVGLMQCDGSAVGSSGNNDYVTLFVERGELDPAQDALGGIPGIQRLLTASGTVPATTLRAGPSPLEGQGLVYAEHRRESDGIVTAAGFAEFALVNDLVLPAVTETFPATDCGPAPCWGKNHRWLVRFSEPMDLSHPLASRVEFAPGAVACTNGAFFSDITADSAVTYEPSSWGLSIVPQPQADASYTVRILVSTSAHDSAAAMNPLPPLQRCAVVADSAPPPNPTTPAVTVDPGDFSPDGDGVEDLATFTVTAPPEARIVRVELRRNFAPVKTLLRIVPGAGDWTVTWDGRDDTGRRVLDGWVGWRARVEDEAGTLSTAAEGVLQVDSAVEFIGPRKRLK